jgi:hypothetical protein
VLLVVGGGVYNRSRQCSGGGIMDIYAYAYGGVAIILYFLAVVAVRIYSYNIY